MVYKTTNDAHRNIIMEVYGSIWMAFDLLWIQYIYIIKHRERLTDDIFKSSNWHSKIGH